MKTNLFMFTYLLSCIFLLIVRDLSNDTLVNNKKFINMLYNCGRIFLYYHFSFYISYLSV